MRSTLAFVACLLLTVGCDDPTRFVEAPSELDRSLMIIAVLNPDSTDQPVWIEAADVSEGELGPLETVDVSIWNGDRFLFRVEPDSTDLYRSRACVARYGSLGVKSATACVQLPFQPRHGESYRIEVSAHDHPTATGTAHIPGDFELTNTRADGDPPGTDGLQVQWTESRDSYRYFVALRSGHVDCPSVMGCTDGWFATTGDTQFSGTVPRRELHSGRGPWAVDVYALDRALYEYLTTGVTGELYSVPPSSNVQNGYGVVGVWVRRSRAVGP